MKASSASAVVLLALAVTACNGAGGASTAAAPETVEERASYAIGYGAGEQLGAEEGVDVEQLVAGIRDAFAGTESKMTPEEMQSAMMEMQQMMMDAANESSSAEADANKAEGDAFLAENATKPGVVVLDSGLQYEVIEEGAGAAPVASDEVTVHYEGTLLDGTVFDSSIERGTPSTFFLNQVISGWTEGLQLMKVGSKYRLWVPGDLGYGMNPRPGGAIGPNHALVFEVELLAINGQS
jgi:FKBP-type peptidyl-prolyl cis-trans isomerase